MGEQSIEDVRGKPRRRVLKAGTISFAHGAAIDCLLRNISETGALLEVESPIGIPDTFDLLVRGDAGTPSRAYQIVWRSSKRIGVKFV